MPSEILVARVISAHGLKGEVRARLYVAQAAKLADRGELRTGDGRHVLVTRVHDVRADQAILAFKDVSERGAAESFAGAELFLSRDALPELSDGEFYHADLVGLPAYDSEDRLIGHVAAIANYGAGDVVEIARGKDDTLLIAFTRANVPVVDLKSGRLVVAVPDEIEAKKR